MSGYVSHMCGPLLSFCRLSKEITDVEENIPNVVKFRSGQTKVDDVKKVYLTGQYRQKYKIISDNNYTNSPVKSAQYRIYPTLEIGGRKIRSAYPNVRIKNADREPYKHIYTPSIFIPDRMNNETLGSNIPPLQRQALIIPHRNNNNFISPMRSPTKNSNIFKVSNGSPTKNSNIIKVSNEPNDSFRYSHRTE